MELQEMYDELAKLVEEMRQYLDEHEDEDESLSVEEAETYDKMEKRARELQNKIAREEAWAACKPILNNPGEGVQNFLPTRSARGIVGGEYHKNFLNAFRTNFRHARGRIGKRRLPFANGNARRNHFCTFRGKYF